MNQTLLEKQYQRVLRKHQKFSLRFERKLQSEEKLGGRKLHRLQQRLLKFRNNLGRLQHLLKLAGKGLAVGALLLGNFSEAEAQNKTKVPAFATVSDNPFGFTDVGFLSAPTFADLDGDGDLDAFVGENNRNIKYFENTGDSNTPAFSLSTSASPFGLSDVGNRSSPSFADLDGDGDLDAFVGEINGNIKYFENTGESNTPAFSLSASASPFGLSDVGFVSSPSFADLDGDGDLDAFVGHNYGNIKYFENTGDSNTPAFAAVSDNPFGFTDVGFVSSPSFADLDGDGDLDAFVGEEYGDIKYFENTGDSNTPAFAAVSNNPFGFSDVGSNSSPTFADLDGDGDLDAFVGEFNGNIKYFENTGVAFDFSFATVSDNPFGLTDVGFTSAPTFADLDGDGDLDAFVGENVGNINYFENTGTNNAPAFSLSTLASPFGLTDIGFLSVPTFADLDGDGDLDAFVGEQNGNTNYFENTGTSNAPAFSLSASTEPFGLTDIGTYSSPVFADLDGDGDLDAFVGENVGNINYFENTGTSNAPAFSLSASTVPFGLADIGVESKPSFADLDGDGDLDAFVGENNGNINYFENTGSSNVPAFSLSAPASPFGLSDVGFGSSPTFADLDGDGDLDAFVGERFGNINYFENHRLIVFESDAWSNVSGPIVEDFAQIKDDFDSNADGDIIAGTLTIEPTFTLTIADGDKVELAGDLANSGTILVQNNGALVQTKATPSNTGAGTYTVERLADKSILVYNYFSSPVIGETVADVFATNGTNFYSFDVASQGWTALPTATVLGAGDGFIATGNGNSGTITRIFTSNAGFNSGDITKAITIVGTGGTDDDDWNLVGNPYPSGLDFQSFYTSNSANIGTAIYLWDSDGDDVGATDADYATMTSAGSTSTTVGGAGSTTGDAVVASGQGFFVEALNNANITFSNSHRSATNNVFFRTKGEMQRLWLSAKHEDGASNQILIAFAENADEKSDIFDGKKRSESETLSFYMPVTDFEKGVDSEKLAIQGLPTLDEGRIVELGIEAKQSGKFTFALDKSEYLENQAIFLHDLQTNKLVDITKESYSVELPTGDHSDRFTLRFVGEKVTSISSDLAETGVSIFSHSNRIQINFSDLESAKSNIAIYDLQGRLILAQSNQSKLQTSLELPKSGIFIVKVENAKGILARKVYVGK